MELEFWPCAGERNARVQANDSESLKNSIELPFIAGLKLSY